MGERMGPNTVAAFHAGADFMRDQEADDASSDAAVEKAVDQGINTHHESPGRASDLHISMLEALILEILFNDTLQLVERLAGEIGRQLFGTDLKKKGGSHGVNTTAGDFIGSRFATFK